MQHEFVKLYLRITIKQEIPTYLLPVTVLLYFCYMCFPFANNLETLELAAVCGILALLVGGLFKFSYLQPIRICLEPGESVNRDGAEAQKRALRIPRYEALLAMVRWSITGIVMAIALRILKDISLQDMLLIFVLTFFSGLISMPYYLLVCEIEINKFLSSINADQFSSYQNEKSFSISAKFIFTIVPLFIYIIGLFLLSFFLWLNNYLTKDNILMALVVFLSSSLIYSAMVIYYYLKNYQSKVKHLLLSMKDAAQGEGDLTKKLPLMSKDELSEIAFYYNMFISALNRLIRQLKDYIDKNSAISNDLAVSSEESFVSLEQMQKNITNMKNKALRLDDNILQSNQLAAKLKELIEKVVQFTLSQSTYITESSSSIEEMSGSIQNVAQTSEKKLSILNHLQAIAADGEKLLAGMINIINKASASTQKIIDIVKIINGIASQTNLLAMNAAIEAAHAGDAGRGFSVVASEIRKLAEDTSKNSKIISVSLKEIINSITVSEQSSQKTGEHFKNIVGGIKDVADSMSEIKNAMDDLAVGGKDITDSLGELIQMSQQIDNSSNEMKKDMEKIAESFDFISAISSENRNGMEEVVTGINEIYKSVQLVSSSGNQNFALVSDLAELVKRFKTQNT